MRRHSVEVLNVPRQCDLVLDGGRLKVVYHCFPCERLREGYEDRERTREAPTVGQELTETLELTG